MKFVFVPGEIYVGLHADTAWVADRATLVRERRPRVLLRVTAVLVREQGRWTIAQVHLSAGVPNEELFGSRFAATVEDLADRASRDAALATGGLPTRHMTIVFTDIESSTDHLARIGDEKWLELVNWRNWKVREAVVARGGHEVSTQGDGFMLAFTTVDTALDCMLDLRSVFEASEGVWDADNLRVRMGAHAGPVSETVVKAARISAHAAGGEALVSVEMAGQASGFAFGESRSLLLKGLKGDHRVLPLIGRSDR